MLLAIVRMPAPPNAEGAAELERRFAERLPQVAQAHGFAGFELLRPTEGGDHYLSVSRWVSRADFDAWRMSTYNATAHGRPAPVEGAAAAAAPARPAGGGAEVYELVEI